MKTKPLVTAFRRLLSFGAGVASIFFAWLGQLTLIRQDRLALAALFYAIAFGLLLAFLGGRGRRLADAGPHGSSASEPPTKDQRSEQDETIKASATSSVAFDGRRLPLTLTVASALGGVVAVLLAADPESPLAPWLWFASLAVLTLGALGLEQGGRFCVLRCRHEDPYDPGRPRPSRVLEGVIVAVLMLVALWLRVVDLETHPGIHGDEGERGVAAHAVLEGEGPSLFGFAWGGVPALYFYCLAPFLHVFGETMFAVRLFSVMCGAASVWLVYRIGRQLWGVRAGLLAGALQAIAPLGLQFSRHAGESAATGALWATGFLFLYRALRGMWWSDWLIAGVFFGLSFYFYQAGRLIVVGLVCLILYSVLRWRWRTARGWCLLTLALVLTLLPQQVFSLKEDWSRFLGRAREASIVAPQNRPLVFASHGLDWDPEWSDETLVDSLLEHSLAWIRVGIGQLKATAEVFYRNGDPTTFYSIRLHRGSLLSPLLASLTLLGFGWALSRVRDGRYGVAVIWLVTGLLPAAVTINTPSVQRLTGAWPVVVLFPAVLLDRVAAALWRVSPGVARIGGSALCAALIAPLAAASWSEYFDHYRALCPHCDATAQARYVEALGQDYKAYQLGVGERDVLLYYGSTRFIAGDTEGRDVTAPANALPVTDNGEKGAAFLVYPHNLQYLPLIQLFHPGGERQDVAQQDGQRHFVSYRLEADDIAAQRVLEAVYEDARGRLERRWEPNLGTSRATGWEPPRDMTYPVEATWTGGLMAPRYGVYTFSPGTRVTDLRLDGRSMLPPRSESIDGEDQTGVMEAVLARGLHEIRLHARLEDPDAKVELRWAPPARASTPVPPPFLFRGPLGGLSGEVWTSVEGASLADLDELEGVPPSLRRSDPFFGFRALTDVVGSEPLVARWRGWLDVPVTGAVTFEIRSNGEAQLLVDGTPLSVSPAGERVRDELELSRGSHSVELRYAWTSGRAQLEWYWAPPGRELEIVPPTVLRPAPRSWPRGEIAGPFPAATSPALTANVDARVAAGQILGRAALLSEPRGVGVDDQGRVFVGDTGNRRVVRLEDDRVTATWGSPASERGPGAFALLSDLAVADDGRVATLDQANGDVVIFDADGEVLLHVPRVSSNASGIHLTREGEVWVADTGGSRILRLGAEGRVAAVWTGEGLGFQRLEQPIDVVLDSRDSVYAVDLRHRIVRFDGEGRIEAQWGVEEGRLRGGSHLAIHDGLVVMTQPDLSRLVVLDPADGSVRHLDAGLRIPVGLAEGPDGRLYVVDSEAASVHVYSRLD